jgi:ribonuclease HI
LVQCEFSHCDTHTHTHTCVRSLAYLVVAPFFLFYTIHFGWVEVHIGIEGNEEADMLAKEATQEDEEQNTHAHAHFSLFR